MSKIAVISGSVRRDGNTALLARTFAEAAAEKNEVTFISLADLHIAPCIGCNFCYTSEGNRCCRRDDMDGVYEALRPAELIVIATPVYFYGVSAQLKALIDRLHNPVRSSFSVKRLALIGVGADTIPELFDSILSQYRLVLDYFGLRDAGRVLVRGARDKGDAAGNAEALEQVRLLGLSV